jgi:predicted transcriptional regulator
LAVIKKIVDAQKAQKSGIPQEVVEAHVLRNESIIKAWHEHLGLRQKDLAKRLGISQTAVAKFEHSEIRPRLSTIRKITVALKLDETQLVADVS